MTAAEKAWELRGKLFALAGEFKALHLSINAVPVAEDTTLDGLCTTDARCTIDAGVAQ